MKEVYEAPKAEYVQIEKVEIITASGCHVIGSPSGSCDFRKDENGVWRYYNF